MIRPDNKRLKSYHLILSFTFYFDLIYTSLIIGNYNFHLGIEPDYMQNVEVYYILILF